MTFVDVCLALEIKSVCFGECGLSATRHRTGVIDPFDVIHWSDRRMSRRALRRFLLLVARRERMHDPYYLNDPKYNWQYLHIDNTEAGRLAATLGIRLPAALSRNDRLACLTLARKAGVRLSASHPAIYAWARRGLDV